MAKGTACSQSRLVRDMMACSRSCASAFARGVEDESHAAAGHAAEHPEAPEIVAEFLARRRDQRFRVKRCSPRE